jgi:hypothetical protein
MIIGSLKCLYDFTVRCYNYFLKHEIIIYFGRLMIIGSLKCLYDFTVRCSSVSFGARGKRVILRCF